MIQIYQNDASDKVNRPLRIKVEVEVEIEVDV